VFRFYVIGSDGFPLLLLSSKPEEFLDLGASFFHIFFIPVNFERVFYSPFPAPPLPPYPFVELALLTVTKPPHIVAVQLILGSLGVFTHKTGTYYSLP